jgi:L-aminopeptidase/D-esterase-like protein
VLVGTEAAQIGDNVVDLLRRQQLSPYRHDLREAARRPAVRDHVFPGGVGFGRGLIALGEIGKGVRPLESRGRLGSAPPIAAMTSDTRRLEDARAVPNVGRFGVFQALREQQTAARQEKIAQGDDADEKVHTEFYISEPFDHCNREYAAQSKAVRKHSLVMSVPIALKPLFSIIFLLQL